MYINSMFLSSTYMLYIVNFISVIYFHFVYKVWPQWVSTYWYPIFYTIKLLVISGKYIIICSSLYIYNWHLTAIVHNGCSNTIATCCVHAWHIHITLAGQSDSHLDIADWTTWLKLQQHKYDLYYIRSSTCFTIRFDLPFRLIKKDTMDKQIDSRNGCIWHIPTR